LFRYAFPGFLENPGKAEDCNVLAANLAALILIGAGVFFYTRGWLRLHRGGYHLARPFRLLVFWGGSLLAALALVYPLPLLYQEYLYARTAQFVLLCLMAAPAFFTSAGYDVIAAGLPRVARRRMTATVLRTTRSGRFIRRITPGWLCWMAFITAFVLWQEPILASWILLHPPLYGLLLGVLAGLALLFWWHVIGTGPRLHRELSPWLAAFLLVLTELTNMATALSLTFATEPYYPYYVAHNAGAPAGLTLADQHLAGGLLWVGGSMVYIAAIILVLNRLFERHGADRPHPLPDWDADERMIMPGLEHRVKR
jgi:cytochrome c oxidase assembly factor CtaG